MPKYSADQCKSFLWDFHKAPGFDVDMTYDQAAFAVARAASISAGTASAEHSFACSVALVDAAS